MKTMTLICLLASACTVDPGDGDTASDEAAATVAQWLDDVQVPNQMSAREPGLAYYGSKLHMVHNGNSYPNDLWWSTFDGASWSTNVKLNGFESDAGPALASYAGKLYMAFKVAGQHTIDVTTSTGTSWTTPVAIPLPWYLEAKHAPSVTAYGTSLYVASCINNASGDEGIVLASFNGASWTWSIANTDMYEGTCESVALQPIDGQLHLVSSWHWLESDWSGTYIDESPIYEQALLPTWTDLGWLDMHSRRPVAMTTCNGNVFLVHGGDDTPDQIWWSMRPATGSGSWIPNERLTNQTSDAGAGIGCFDTTPIIVHNGGTNQLWWASYR